MNLYSKLIIIVLTFSFSKTYSQCTDINRIGISDIYGLDIKIVKKLISKKMNCGSQFLNKKKATLYKVKVKNIIFIRDTTVYSELDLYKVKYIIIDSSHEIRKGNSLQVLGSNSSVKNYIVCNEILPLDCIYQLKIPKNEVRIVNLEECYKLNFVDRIKLLFIKDNDKIFEKIYTKPRNEEKKNKFLKYILSMEEISD